MPWQLHCWVCDAYNTQTSGKGFKTTCTGLRCHFSAVSLPHLCLFWDFPSSVSDHGYSQVTGWHTFQRTKSPSEDNTCIHAHLSKGTHMQTQTCTLRHLTCTKLHTKKGKPYVYTHTSIRIQSPRALCLPNLHLISPYVSLTKQERALNSL